jgi:hypothetical protein
MLFLSDKGDIVTVTGGADTITDAGSDNTYGLPAASEGSDTFTGNVLHAGPETGARGDHVERLFVHGAAI